MPIQPNKQYPCTGVNFDCHSLEPNCSDPTGFDLQTLWIITYNYWEQCPNGSWLDHQPGRLGPVSIHTLALTDDAARAITGSGWTKYPTADIWTRLTTWKFPLFQLVANSPRAPLGLWVEVFTIVHFLGNPIGSIRDLLKKLDECQSRAVFWQNRLDDHDFRSLRLASTPIEHKRLWKSLAIIVKAFDEWGPDVGDNAESCLSTELARLCSPATSDVSRRAFLQTCLETADALAADTATKFLPVAFAQGLYIASIAVTMIRAKLTSEGSSPSSYIDVEMHSIAFTAQYFWIIFAVFWTSVMGASQTSAFVPRTLQQFRLNLQRQFKNNSVLDGLSTDNLEKADRIHHGGIYSWQPFRRSVRDRHNSSFDRLKSQTHSAGCRSLVRNILLRFWPLIYKILPLAIVATAAITGQTISAFVPPGRWSCRSNGMICIFITWLVNYAISSRHLKTSNRALFWITFVKDLLAVGVTFGIVIATQIGVYNRVDCYTNFGTVGLQLPTMPFVHDILQSRLNNVYPIVVTLGIAFQLILAPALLIWRYHAAVQVFLHRDDGTSGLDFWRTLQRWRELITDQPDRPSSSSTQPSIDLSSKFKNISSKCVDGEGTGGQSYNGDASRIGTHNEELRKQTSDHSGDFFEVRRHEPGLFDVSNPTLLRTLMSIPNRSINFIDDDTLVRRTVSEKLQLYVEDSLGEECNWWPMEQPRPDLPKDMVRVCWICHCGDVFFEDIPHKEASKYQATLKARGTWYSTEHGCSTDLVTTANRSSVDKSFPSRSHPSTASSSRLSQKPDVQSLAQSADNLHSAREALKEVTIPISDPSHSLVILGVQDGEGLCDIDQLDVKGLASDGAFFANLKAAHDRIRGRIPNWFSVWRFEHCNFVKFQKSRANIVFPLCEELPVSPDYEYSPKPPEAKPPVIHRHEFAKSLRPCAKWEWLLCNAAKFLYRHKCTSPSSRTTIIQRIPKKREPWLVGTDELDHAYGFDACYVLSFWRMLMYHLTILSPSLVFTFTWLQSHHGDLQDAVVPLATSLAGLSLFWALFLGLKTPSRRKAKVV